MTDESPLDRYHRFHALHDVIVDTANRIIELADLPGAKRLWWLSDTRTVLLEARHIRAMAAQRWSGFPMSNELQTMMAQLDDEIARLPERAIISYQRIYTGIDKPADYNTELSRLAELLDIDGDDAAAIAAVDFTAATKHPDAPSWAAYDEEMRRSFTPSLPVISTACWRTWKLWPACRGAQVEVVSDEVPVYICMSSALRTGSR